MTACSSILIHKIKFGIHEQFRNRKTTQFELSFHDISIDDDLFCRRACCKGTDSTKVEEMLESPSRP